MLTLSKSLNDNENDIRVIFKTTALPLFMDAQRFDCQEFEILKKARRGFVIQDVFQDVFGSSFLIVTHVLMVDLLIINLPRMSAQLQIFCVL
jgi:hypothetical protein